jgi:surfactin synthase thioesterase subunit
LTLRSDESAERRLVCFPFGGGSPHAFRQLAAHLPPGWSACGVNPPGHIGTRGEPLESVEEIAALYLDVLPRDVLEGSLLIGHSLGGYVALAVARGIAARGGRCAGVVVCAVPPPHRIAPGRPLTRMSDAELFGWSTSMGATPGAAAVQHELFDLFGRALRADIVAYETFADVPFEPPACPLLAVGGVDDPLCTRPLLEAWREAVPRATIAFVPGPHLFLLDHGEDLARALDAFAAAG